MQNDADFFSAFTPTAFTVEATEGERSQSGFISASRRFARSQTVKNNGRRQPR